VKTINEIKYLQLSDTIDFYSIVEYSPFITTNISVISETERFKDDINQFHETDNNVNIENWLKNTERIGKNGEIIALKYLSEIYNDVTDVSNDYTLGYDILADSELFEVKTTEKSSNILFISHHELVVAYANRENHHLLFIKVRPDGVWGYIFDNIFDCFNIDSNEFFKRSVLIDNDEITLTSVNYKVVIDEKVLESTIPIDLSLYSE